MLKDGQVVVKHFVPSKEGEILNNFINLLLLKIAFQTFEAVNFRFLKNIKKNISFDGGIRKPDDSL